MDKMVKDTISHKEEFQINRHVIKEKENGLTSGSEIKSTDFY